MRTNMWRCTGNTAQEADMARQHTSSQALKAIVGAALVGLGLVILFGKLDGPAVQLTNLLAAAAREALELLRAPSRCWYHSGRCSASCRERHSCGMSSGTKSKTCRQ